MAMTEVAVRSLVYAGERQDEITRAQQLKDACKAAGLKGITFRDAANY
jgi:hypothetical protein